MTDDHRYLEIGTAFGLLAAIVAFIGGWWYCTATYGFLFGFGLGWLPSVILAGITFFAVRYLWAPAVALAGFLILQTFVSDRADNAPYSDTAANSFAEPSAPPMEAESATGSDSYEPLAPGSSLDWEADKSPEEVYRQVGPLHVTIRKSFDGDLVAPLVDVQSEQGSVTLVGQPTIDSLAHRISGVVLVKGKPPVVMLQSFSGGAHCCNYVTLAGLFDGKLRTVDLGSWDGEEFDPPKDANGDGVSDFVLRDDSFLYAFAPYALSWSPPKILNVVNGRIIDVSAKPAFRRFFQQDMNKADVACQKGGNGACAAYVADAARIGRLGAAWVRMLNAYNPNSDWELPTACKVATSDACPEEAAVHFSSFPDALLYFLKAKGYIVSGWMPPKASVSNTPSSLDGQTTAPDITSAVEENDVQ